MAYYFFRPASIVDCIIGLHARDNFQLGKSFYICRSNVLRVLNAETPVAVAILLLYIFKYIKQRMDCLVTNSVDHDLKTSAVSGLDAKVKNLWFNHKKTRIAGSVVEWFKECGCVRSKRSVDKFLQVAEAKPLVTCALCLNFFSQFFPL